MNTQQVPYAHRNPYAHFAAGDRFAKLAGINELPADADSWSAVLDRATGLIWPVAELAEEATQDEAEKLASECRVFGLSDWQLAHIADYESIITRNAHGPAVHPEFAALMGESLHSDWHWTSVRDASDPESCAWYVGLNGGNVSIDGRGYRLRARVVRSAVPGQ
jgi:hypothetical protein